MKAAIARIGRLGGVPMRCPAPQIEGPALYRRLLAPFSERKI